jgi:hypothetical protein
VATGRGMVSGNSQVAAGQGGRGGGTAARARVVGLAVLTAARQGQGGRRAQPGGSSKSTVAAAGWQKLGQGGSIQVAGWQQSSRVAAELPGGSRAAWWQQSNSRVAASWGRVAAAAR